MPSGSASASSIIAWSSTGYRAIATAERGSRLRAFARLALIGAGLLFYVPMHGLTRLIGRESHWPKRFLAFTARAGGVDVECEGTPLRHHVLFAANHTSWLDILVLTATSGATFVAKDDIERWPLVGWLASLNRTIFIARTQRGQVREQADTIAAALARGQPVAFFPEGTTDGGAEILPFRAALFAAVAPPPPGVMVQPALIDYGDATGDILWLKDEPAWPNVIRVLGRPGRMPVRAHFLPPIDPATLGDRKAISAAAREAIVGALGEARGHPLYRA